MSNADPAAVVTEFAAHVLQPSEMDAVVRRVNDEITVELPMFGTDTELRRDLAASTAGQLRAFTASLLVDAGEIRPAPAAIDLARTIARRGMELSVLLHIYRHGQQSALRYLNEGIQIPDVTADVRAAALTRVWAHAAGWFSMCVEQLIVAYAEERESWLRSALARRTQQVDAILRGDPTELTSAEALLGHRLRPRQTALVITAADDAEGTSRLEAVAARLGTILGAARPLLVPVSSGTLWAWLATDHDPDLRRLATAPQPAADIRIGVGGTASGIDGFRSSHREAVAALLASNRPLVVYSDVEVVSLLSADRAAQQTFVARELGPLAGPANAKLRDAALAYLALGAGGAATHLGVHRNTIRYRIEQAEGLLGRSLASRRLELHLALLCAETDSGAEG